MKKKEDFETDEIASLRWWKCYRKREDSIIIKFTKNLERKGQLYIDGYSIREKKTNDNLNEFKTKNKFFSIKRMNNELQAFIDYKEKLEEERIQMLELEIEKKKNEELNLLIENNKPFEEFKERIKNFKFGQSENILIKPQINEEEITNNKLEEYNNYIAYRTQYKLNNNVKKKIKFNLQLIRVKNDDNKKFQRDEERKKSILNVDQEKLKENIKKQIEYVRKQSAKAPQELKIPNPPKST